MRLRRGLFYPLSLSGFFQTRVLGLLVVALTTTSKTNTPQKYGSQAPNPSQLTGVQTTTKDPPCGSPNMENIGISSANIKNNRNIQSFLCMVSFVSILSHVARTCSVFAGSSGPCMRQHGRHTQSNWKPPRCVGDWLRAADPTRVSRSWSACSRA